MDTTFSTTTLAGRAAHLFFPEMCLLCNKRIATRHLFCSRCLNEKPITRATQVHENLIWQQHYVYNYEGTGKTLFKAAKFNERRRAQKFFIQSARTHLIPLINAKTGVIAIPSRYKFLSKLLKVCVPKEQLFSDVLQIKQKPFSKVANKTLSAAGRYARVYENLQWNTLSWRKQKFERYLLCDDVSTSGATLERAAYLLKAHLDLKDEQILFWALMYRPRLPLEETTS